ncbi:hypothetical protein D0962_12440 [Leptolyngbyaceae cyanobacterium CCMR0082]|uniref:Uncharacterized protein n=2 Tax=Adonisia turfae TaxID=2950184 RepID=A0A6M0S5F2_9CYAN|nr:hypothetical protein [Adonisia turfae]MDV3347084.1 hypothetical protein [Leptothoe sp. LEGE 181152]NEZ55460.1 hypothetical protein [Adonisia turfae CCMR0081]NEZ63580.1 hypothetical protein [Adonisia turfae CCMR0082]
MDPNQDTGANQADINDTLNSILSQAMSLKQDIDENQPDDNATTINNILLRTAYEQIPAKTADAIPGLEIFEDNDNPGSWFWEWEWGECQDGPHENELEALISFARFSAELATELGDDDE